MEWITVVDLQRTKLKVKSREAIHQDGDWHETFQCWFVERVGEQLYIHLQKRSKYKRDFPSHYDITAAGHLMAGETVRDGVREVKEELGIEVDFDNLLYIGAIPNSIHNPTFHDNEISLVYVHEISAPYNYQFLDEEVEQMIRVPFESFINVIEDQQQVNVEVYVDGTFSLSTESLSFKQLVPHEKAYFEQVIIFIATNYKRVPH